MKSAEPIQVPFVTMDRRECGVVSGVGTGTLPPSVQWLSCMISNRIHKLAQKGLDKALEKKMRRHVCKGI